jgi:hypothetical protein
LIIDNGSISDMSDNEWLEFQASKALLRQCELTDSPIPKSSESLRRRAELLCLEAA